MANDNFLECCLEHCTSQFSYKVSNINPVLKMKKLKLGV